MPIYEYRCNDCTKTSSFLLLRVSEEIEPYCKACGSRSVKRLLSRVSVLKSEERRLEGLLDPAKLSDLDENDPASIERVMRRMGRELGDELGEGFQESLEESLGELEPMASEE
jgi:putative FmdB family regulatory protein